MTQAIAALEREDHRSPGAIDAFLESHQLPLVEGRDVTFVYRGPAELVTLQHWIHGLPGSQRFRQIPGTDLWYLVIDLPRRSRMEYKFGLVVHGQQQLIRDPLNPNLARDPFGANSVVYGEGYAPPEWTQPDPEARPGDLRKLEFESEAYHGRRSVQVYLPARFRRIRRHSLLVVHDGTDFLQYANLQTVLDNLIHRLEIPPLVVALTDSPSRLEEYSGDDRHARFLADELLPSIEAAFPMVATPEARGLMGASFGAVAALHAAWRRPGVFGKLLLQSGSFAFTDIGTQDCGPAFDPVVTFVNAFRKAPGRPADQVFATCGVYEPLIYYNRSMVPLLQDTGMDVRYREARDGHNWENWRDRLREGLSWLFPGPLWMVYE